MTQPQPGADVPELATLKAQQVDPNLIRWCEWPGCFANFDATTGPAADGGPMWMRINGRVLLCPDHAHIGHQPGRYEWNPDVGASGELVMSCQCGVRSEALEPTTLQRCLDWWAGHVHDVTPQLTESPETVLEFANRVAETLLQKRDQVRGRDHRRALGLEEAARIVRAAAEHDGGS
jgi:hypothetical protein